MEWSGGFWGGIPAPARIYFWGQKKGKTPREHHSPKENNQQLHYQRSFHEGQEFHEKKKKPPLFSPLSTGSASIRLRILAKIT
jgi:hypothetical protein